MTETDSSTTAGDITLGDSILAAAKATQPAESAAGALVKYTRLLHPEVSTGQSDTAKSRVMMAEWPDLKPDIVDSHGSAQNIVVIGSIIARVAVHSEPTILYTACRILPPPEHLLTDLLSSIAGRTKGDDVDASLASHLEGYQRTFTDLPLNIEGCTLHFELAPGETKRLSSSDQEWNGMTYDGKATVSASAFRAPPAPPAKTLPVAGTVSDDV